MPPITDRPLRIGLLGAARIAPGALIEPAAARDDVSVVCVAARDPERARAFAAAHGIPDTASDYAALIARDDIDLVYIALPPHLHREWAIRALEAGRHVLVEKPFALDAAEAAEMVAAAGRNGRHLIEAFHYRFHPLMHVALALVSDGAIGRIVSARGWAEYPIPVRDGEPRWTPGIGGGALMDLGCYPIHALRTLIGSEPVVISAQAEMALGVDAEADVTLDFAGVTAEVRASMRPPAPATGIDLHGEHGRIELRGFILAHRNGVLRLIRDGVARDIPVGGGTTYAAQLDHVIAVLRGATAPATGGQDSVANMQVVDAVRARIARDITSSEILTIRPDSSERADQFGLTGVKKGAL